MFTASVHSLPVSSRLCLLVITESYATNPMIPLPLFRIPGFSAIQVFTFLL